MKTICKVAAYMAAFICYTANVTSQQLSYTDAAQSYNRLLIEKNNSTYYQISNYKVIGSPYLFGEKHLGTLFTKEKSEPDILVSYNLFNQEVGFYSPKHVSKPLILKDGFVDSFELEKDPALEIKESMRFIYAPLIGLAENCYYQKMNDGPTYKLYKKYTATLEIVTTNYIQSELRQFSVDYSYYYRKSGTDACRKIKLNRNAIIKEFKSEKDLTALLPGDDFSFNPEAYLKIAFEELNK